MTKKQKGIKAGVPIKFWSKHETELLQKFYKQEGAEAVGKRTGRTPKAVREKARMMGIQLPKREKTKQEISRKSSSLSSSEKPVFEEPDVKITAHPRAGDSAAFRGLLDKMTDRVEEAESQAAAPGSELAAPTIADVVSIIKLPFEMWAIWQKLDGLRLGDDEAYRLAAPVNRIVDRHDLWKYIKPDLVDATILIAVLSLIMLGRFQMVKDERQRREQDKTPAPAKKPAAPVIPTKPEAQGAAFTQPIEM